MAAKGTLERLKLAELLERLRKDDGRLIVWVETPEQPVRRHEPETGAAAADRLDKLVARFPAHVVFRAYRADVEYAWLGTEGIAALVGTKGDLEVEGGTVLAEWGERIAVEHFVSAGRRVYQKLRELDDHASR